MKNTVLVYALLFLSIVASAQNSVSFELSGVKEYEGTIFISLFNCEQAYKEKQVYLSITTKPIAETISIPLSLPDGEYFFSVFQDSNENGKLDTNLVGIPKELVGLSNYDGTSVPGNFNRHKVPIIQTSKTIKVRLFKI